MRSSKPMFLYNSNTDDMKAMKEIKDANIQCEIFGPISDEQTPLVIYKRMRFYGLDGIKNFIKKWKIEEK